MDDQTHCDGGLGPMFAFAEGPRTGGPGSTDPDRSPRSADE